MDIKRNLKKAWILCRGIYSYNILRYFGILSPKAMQINVTYRCNSQCAMCHIWKMKPKDELTFAEWKKIMKDPIFSKIERLTIAGGEPTCHSDLIKLIRLFLVSMPKLQFLSLITNGFLPKITVSRIRSLAVSTKKRGINLSVTVSLDGIGKMHEAMRRVPKAFKKTSATIMALNSLRSKYNFRLGVACVVCRKNLYHVEEVEKWCKVNKIPFNFQLIGFHETFVQNMDKKDKLDFRKKDKKYLYKTLQKSASGRFWKGVMTYYWNDILRMYKDNALRTTPCPFAIDAFVLDSFGDVYYCLSEKKIGNCRKGKTVSEIYYDSDNLAFRQWMAKNPCLKCNSACAVRYALRKDFRKFVWFYLTGKRGPVGVC